MEGLAAASLDGQVHTVVHDYLLYCREHALRNAGFQDPFLSIKTEENARALQLLPSVCAEIDAEEDSERRWELCIRGVCAANIFDLGAAHTSDMYHQASFSRSKVSMFGWKIIVFYFTERGWPPVNRRVYNLSHDR